jgi:hypothetical protein
LFGDSVGIAVWRGSSIFEVAALVFTNVTRNAHRSAAVGDTVAEIRDVARLEATSETPLVVETVVRIVCLDVKLVICLELIDSRVDFSEIENQGRSVNRLAYATFENFIDSF